MIKIEIKHVMKLKEKKTFIKYSKDYKKYSIQNGIRKINNEIKQQNLNKIIKQ